MVEEIVLRPVELMQTAEQARKVVLQALQVTLPLVRVHLTGEARLQSW